MIIYRGSGGDLKGDFMSHLTERLKSRRRALTKTNQDEVPDVWYFFERAVGEIGEEGTDLLFYCFLCVCCDNVEMGNEVIEYPSRLDG